MNQNPFKQLDSVYQASLNNAYRAATVRQGANRMLPEGKYQCIISAFSLKPSKAFPDELNLALGFEVLDGDQRGITTYKFYSITPERMEILKEDLMKLKIDLQDNIVNLGEESTANAILDQIVDITVKHKKRQNGDGFYQNLYITRSYGKEGFTEVDDETPFDTPFD